MNPQDTFLRDQDVNFMSHVLLDLLGIDKSLMGKDLYFCYLSIDRIVVYTKHKTDFMKVAKNNKLFVDTIDSISYPEEGIFYFHLPEKFKKDVEVFCLFENYTPSEGWNDYVNEMKDKFRLEKGKK